MRWRVVDEGPDDQGALFEYEVERVPGRGEYRGLEFLHVRAARIINEVPRAAVVPFRWTINPYRGCSHACVYCFARPTHEYLDLNSGTDFDSKIVVKINAVERLRAELAPSRWAGEHIALGTNTDPYQRCEARYHLTRGIVETLTAAANPFSILTKSTLVLRDIDVLAEAARRTEVAANFSIGTLDEDVWRATEPGTPHPMRRVEAVARLNEAGVPSGVLVAPILPGLSDRAGQLEAVVKACVEAGATMVAPILLHLRPGVREHYLSWLADERPDLRAAYEARYPRAYASRSEHAELSRLVARLVRRHGGRPARPSQSRPAPRPRPPQATRSRQLTFGDH